MTFHRIIRTVVLAAACAASVGAAPEGYLLRIYFDGAAGRLADTSFIPYAISGDAALGEVSAGYARRLAAQGFRFDILAEDPGQKNIWDVNLPLSALPPSAEVIETLGRSHYLVATPREVEIKAGHRAFRLRPRAADFRALGGGWRTAIFAPQDEIADIVAAVNRGRFEQTDRDLAAFGTRYSYSSKCKEAATHISDKLAAAGLRVSRDRYFGVNMEAVAAAGGGVAWAAGKGGVVCRSTDGGASWQVLGPVAAGNVNAVACTSADTAWLAADNGEVLRTGDGGVSWQPSDLGPGDVNDIYFLDNDRGWAVTTAGNVFGTGDGGASWQKHAALGAWLRGVAFADTDHGVISGSDGYLAWTDDGGTNWHRVGGTPDYRLEAVSFRSASEAYVVGEGGTVLRSADGGVTWTPLDFGTEIYFRDVAFQGNAGVIVGALGGVWRTSGAGWEQESAPKYILHAVALAPGGAMWCGTGGGALLYSPRPGTWEDQAQNADANSPYVWENVWARRAGTGDLYGTVLAGAHYDSVSEESSPTTPDVPAPGADDNATGTTAVIEFARASRGHTFRRDIIYVCYSGEEEGLLGSSHFAAKLASAGEPLLGIINMDMLGYADKLPEDANLVTNHASAWFSEYTRRAAATYVPSLGVATTLDDDMWRSDHASYWHFGYASYLMIEDWPITYEWSNTKYDVIENVNFDVGTLMTRGAVAAAAALAAPTSVPVPTLLDAVEVYPNPYKSTSHHGLIFFANLPPYSKIAIYNLAGEALAEGANGPEPIWTFEAETEPRALKATGVYFYVIEAADGQRKIGKLAIIR